MVSKIARVCFLTTAVLSPLAFAAPAQIPAALAHVGADSIRLPMLHATIQRADLITTMQGLRSSIAQLEDRALTALQAEPGERVYVHVETTTDSIWITPVEGHEKEVDKRQAASFVMPNHTGVYNFAVEAFWRLPSAPDGIGGYGSAIWGLRVTVR